MTKETCLNKQQQVIQSFVFCKSPEEVYKKIIYYGQLLSHFPDKEKIEENLVRGCQSQTYLTGTIKENNLVEFQAHSEALISAGIAYLFIQVYSQEDIETILTCAPLFFEKMQLPSLLSPNRSNGALSLHLKLKQIATSFLIQQKK